MKFYTKEWYELMQRLDYTVAMKPIADKEYSDADIAALYEKEKKAAIARDRRDYNTPPQFVPLDFDEFELDDFCFYDEETGMMKHPSSMDEVKREYEREQAQAAEEFENRPPFDPAETVETFEAMYQGLLEHGYLRFPEWVKGEVDIRLIALGFLPKSVYDRLKAEQKRNKAEFDKLNRTARKTLDREAKNIPEHVLQKFGFHDGAVLGMEPVGADIVMTVEKDCGALFDGETPYVRVTFVDGKVIERDDGLSFEPRIIDSGDAQYTSHCTWLYDELYKTVSGLEAHMLLADMQLCYLTIACSDIVIEENIKYNSECVIRNA